jgi:hypothetical protein
MDSDRSRNIRAISATANGATAAAKSASITRARPDNDASASNAPWNTSTAAMPAASRSTKSTSRLPTVTGSERTRKLASSATKRTSAASATVARRASTTAYANEIGIAARSGGRSSMSSPAAIAPPMSASAAHPVPG